MTTSSDLQARPPATLADRWEAARRRARPALWVGLSILVVGVLAALLWPATYRATGTILIEQQELPTDLVMSTITSYADQRIQVISQRVMTTENLLRVIQRYDLYPKQRNSEAREVLLERMRRDIHFDMISADVMDPRQGRATKANIAFAVSFDSASPEVAARVANELVSLYLDENLKSRKQQSADAASFLSTEADRVAKQIDSLQANVAKFKDKHINTLPELVGYNNQLLTRSEEELRDVQTELRSLDQQATYLDAQLAQISPSSQVYTATGERVLSPTDRLKFLRTEYARLSGLYSPEHPDVIRTKREMDGLEKSVGNVDAGNDLQRRLDQARSQLAEAQQHYAADHPDIVRLEREVATLTKAVAANPGAPAALNAGARADNPAYIQVKSQREATEATRASLQQKRAELEERINQLEGRLAASPGVERDYADMVRELDNDQLKYREVRQKQMAARLSESLEDQQKGERFTLIDPPLVPEKPASPNRPILAGVALVLALAAALATVALLEANDRSVRNRRDLETLVDVPPLAVLPLLFSEAERRVQRKTRRYALGSALGAGLLALLMTHLLYRPLDVLWEVARRKLGI